MKNTEQLQAKLLREMEKVWEIGYRDGFLNQSYRPIFTGDLAHEYSTGFDKGEEERKQRILEKNG